MVSGANHEFQEGAQILIYDSPSSYNRPLLRIFSSIEVVGADVLHLHLDLPLPVDHDPDAGSPIRIGPNFRALDVNYRRILGDGGDVVLADYAFYWIGILGALDNRETKNAIEIGFQIKPEQASKISLPPSGFGKRLLRFDVTRQAETDTWLDGVLNPPDSKTSPPGDEIPNDEQDTVEDSDNDNDPFEGWVFSFDVPGKKHDARPRYGSMVLPTSFEHTLEGQVCTQELEAKEFVRVFIDDDVFTEELKFEFDEASGSRCSDKIRWASRYNARFTEVNPDFFWPVRFGENFIQRIPD